ncbi:MAG: uracil-DNA glycosylase [Pseudomonadota bacterium]|nr:uracil-DNA glycosylase [Pseudomonadota bacterium]
MSLHLSARQRAMLAEMGIKHWARPQPAEAAPATAAVPAPVAAPAPTAPPRVPATPPARAPAAAEAAAAARPLAPRPEGVADMDWPALQAAVAGCRACGLCAGRTNTVFGVGSQRAQWMVVGEAPGENEDRQGQPFVGQAGKLLDNMLAALGLSRQAELNDPPGAEPAGPADGALPAPRLAQRGVYIANVLKCRPPGNRNPQPDEVAQCEPYLRRQVALVQPRIILAMGRFAVQSLLQTTEPIGRLRGRVHRYQGVPVIVTYHPAYLLRALPEKAKAWEDLCLARATLGSES